VLFSSLIFLSIFLPLVMMVYFIVKKELRNYVLLVASLIFYAWGEPRYLALILFAIILNYSFGIAVETFKYKKSILTVAIFTNLLILIYFKYFNFVVDNINKLGLLEISYINVIMPIGISFLIFHSLSYIIDIYRKEVKAQKNIYNLALYITFFSHLIAGPIIRYHDIQREIEEREDTIENVFYGLKRFSFGLAKKIILANTLGQVSDKIFSLNVDIIDYKIAWLGAICYAFQLYFDFSGYSDMAIGLSRVFGFHFLENFNYPYISKSITEFWRRWHISLGNWFREYLYIPLGGNKKSLKRTYINLFIVFLTTGIWHGANWNFVVWGLWHGVFIILERIYRIENYKKNYQIIMRHIYTLFIVLIGWVLFRTDSLGKAINYLKVMFGFKINEIVGYNVWYYLDNKVFLSLIIALIVSTGIFKFMLKECNVKLYSILINVLSIGLIIISMMMISSSTYNPFIYFRF